MIALRNLGIFAGTVAVAVAAVVAFHHLAEWALS